MTGVEVIGLEVIGAADTGFAVIGLAVTGWTDAATLKVVVSVENAPERVLKTTPPKESV